MRFNEENSGNDQGKQISFPLNNLHIQRTSEYEDEEDEKAYGVFLEDNLLGVFWNEELAVLFKNAAEKVKIVVKE